MATVLASYLVAVATGVGALAGLFLAARLILWLDARKTDRATRRIEHGCTPVQPHTQPLAVPTVAEIDGMLSSRIAGPRRVS